MDDVQKALSERYPEIHPLLFHRSVERSKSNGELFDILDTMPKTVPLAWDAKERCWVETDLLQSERFKSISEGKDNEKH